MFSKFSDTSLDNAKAHWGILILRLVGGGMMLSHGIPKLMKLLSGNFQFADPIGLGPGISLGLTVFAEFLCAILILIGFRTRLASIPLMITMMVAAFIVHGGDPWKKKEFALIYFFVYVALFYLGSGKYSLDHKLKKDN